VNGTGASDLGQLGVGGNQSQNSGGSSSSSSSSGDVNPSTFTQYDKYKNNKDALFGDIKAGSGAQLTTGKKGTVYYKGWLTNGTLVDQSPVSASSQPQPYTFTLGAHEVIPGWEEAIYGMKAGGKRLLIIPPAVGYGSQGKGLVPPNAVLIFEVQLLSVQ
jgi:FKBP-type peptidyl-prolyl cis-trans isomerase